MDISAAALNVFREVLETSMVRELASVSNIP
jgi:hypothetical protein